MSVKNPYKQGGMFEGASHLIFENAKHLRKNMTAAEMNLWLFLRRRVNGLKFRRQHPISIYIADFYCHKVKLVIEVDGFIHNDPVVKEADRIRQSDLEKWGYIVARFTNDEVLQNREKVIEKITDIVNSVKQ